MNRKSRRAQAGHPSASVLDSVQKMYLSGRQCHQEGRIGDAEQIYQHVLASAPRHADSLHLLGVIACQKGHYDLSIDRISKAISIDGTQASYYSNLGIALKEQGRLDEAESSCRKAISIRHDYPEGYNNLGVVLKELSRLNGAEESYRKAIALMPNYPEAHNNLGAALQCLGALNKAVDSYRRALALKPDYPGAHINLAGALLTQGDLSAGWMENEWRWKTLQLANALRNFSQPQWQGEAADGKTLLIHAEQGFGDTLQFCRYAPLVAARGWKVVLEVPPALVRLMRGLKDIDRVVAHGEALPPFDAQCPMMSLPLAMGTVLETIPAPSPYLYADTAERLAWRDRLDALAVSAPRVGIVWAGNPRLGNAAATATDRRRSIAPDLLRPLFGVEGITWFTLQKDGPPPPPGVRLLDAMGGMRDFADTAALISNLDLVISVDTAVAHLAAALGKPVWLLNRFDSCWRWLRDRDDSPWYPTLRQFRQTSPGDWAGVVERVVAALRAMT
jgi:Flp pilus assembly protein TadD